jgi:hypothetical protein
MEDFKITKKEFSEFVENREQLVQAIKETISFQGTNEEFYSNENSIQQYLDIYFNAYKKGDFDTTDNMRLNLYALMGEVVIFLVGGYWNYCSLKKDEAFKTPVIMGWGGTDDRPRISPKVWEILMFEDDDRTKFIKRIQTLKESYSKK